MFVSNKKILFKENMVRGHPGNQIAFVGLFC